MIIFRNANILAHYSRRLRLPLPKKCNPPHPAVYIFLK